MKPTNTTTSNIPKGFAGMSRDNMITAVFSSLHGLEKCVESSQKMFAGELAGSIIVERSLNQQRKVIVQMRRTANKLQIQLAQENWGEVVRSLQIFYGLRQIVRPEIMATFQSLANKELKLSAMSEDTVIH
jgi:hypothetical protein